MSAGAVRDFLSRHGLAASRDLGQNFLVDDALAERLVARAGVAEGDAVIEIGTGLGILTRALAARARRVATLEVDAGLVRALRAEAVLPENVALRHADALDVDLAALARELGAPVRLVANLPYSVSAPLLRRLLDLRGDLVDWSVMIQRDVAERLVARPGSRDYGSLAILHAVTVDVSRESELGPRCFHPVPRVHSSFVRIRPLAAPPLGRRGARGARAPGAGGLRAAPQDPRQRAARSRVGGRPGGAGPRGGGNRSARSRRARRAGALRGPGPSPRGGGCGRGAGSGLMERAALFEALRELAESCGMAVRGIGPGGDVATASGVCRVRGQWWVMLAEGDPLDARIAVLADALRTHAAAELEDRYLPPALRDLLDPGGSGA